MPIELFRFWKLGEAKKNNGVLLLVAPAEHKVRIEVGYGLEGTLTDALSSVIISSAIVPRFKAGDFSGGIERGVDGIISVLSTDAADWQRKVKVAFRRFAQRFRQTVPDFVFPAARLHRLVFDPPRGRPAVWPRRTRRPDLCCPTAAPWGCVGRGRRRFSGGGGFGGGFSGGGGSSGGGGASGGW